MNDNAPQLDFFYSAEYRKPEGDTVEERFASFHELNPHVYRAIVVVARRLVAQGHNRISMRGIFEFLRIDRALRTVGDAYKINNSFSGLFARRVCEHEPDLAPFFELREHHRRSA